MVLVWAGVMGAILGSAANALIYRIPKKISWVRGHSMCPDCKHQLAGEDLIPLLSYIGLRGKCQYCHKPISFRYFAVELWMAVGFFLIFSQNHVFNALILCAIFWVGTIIAVMDWETKLVSEALILIWAGLVILQQFFNLQFSNSNQLSNNLLGLVVSVAIIGGIWAISKGKAMGFGDVEIVAVMGWWLGWPRCLVAIWLAFVLGGIWGGILLALRQGKMKSEVAFGPFLLAGCFIALYWGERVLIWLTGGYANTHLIGI